MNNKIGIFILLSVIVLGALIFFFAEKAPKDFDWVPDLNQDKREPYDFALLQELLKSNYKWNRIEQKEDLKRINRNDKGIPKGYIFAGHYPILSEDAAKEIINFAKEGSEVFLICHSYPDSLFSQIDELSEYRNLSFKASKTIETGFFNPNFEDLKFNFSFKSGIKDTNVYKWTEIPFDLSSDFTALGYFNAKDTTESEENASLNFVRIPIGKGFIYWHSNPLLFTNLFLGKNQKEGISYLNAVLSHFKAEEWYWDYSSTVWPKTVREKQPPRFDKPKTPMEYIFSQPALLMAWLILVVLTVLYALFGAKRKQQAVPIVEANRNTSLEFVNTIGRLYFQQQNHRVIFEKQMQLFKSHLRRRYGIILKEEDMLNSDYIDKLVKRTDIDASVFNEIFGTYLKLDKKLANKDTEMSAETLNKFYQILEKFYQKENARKLKKNNSHVTEN